MATQKQSKSKRPVAKPRARASKAAAAGLAFHHAMIYVRDVGRSLAFYRDALGFRVVEEFPGGYARLCAPSGTTTIALHTLLPGQSFAPANEGMRLYFEVKALERFCAAMVARGVVFAQLPKSMPWGWKHAYLRDPDGHEISLYWAGAARLRATRRLGDH